MGAVIGQIKSIITKRIQKLPEITIQPLWHRNYYERVIRNQFDLGQIRAYIQNNPANWPNDEQ
ncbi:MAG TPA: hypothetical protein VFF78_02965, partial [Anaerolineaceae bacterium]|nr:hypothetical protein [Anaerolineaceae bacterium]